MLSEDFNNILEIWKLMRKYTNSDVIVCPEFYLVL